MWSVIKRIRLVSEWHEVQCSRQQLDLQMRPSRIHKDSFVLLFPLWNKVVCEDKHTPDQRRGVCCWTLVIQFQFVHLLVCTNYCTFWNYKFIIYHNLFTYNLLIENNLDVLLWKCYLLTYVYNTILKFVSHIFGALRAIEYNV